MVFLDESDSQFFSFLEKNQMNKMTIQKFLAVGDLHIKTSNLPEMKILRRGLLNIIQEQKPDMIVFLGDQLHTHSKIHVEPLKFVSELFIDLVNKFSDLEVVVLIGNHERINNQDFCSDIHPFVGLCYQQIPRLTIVRSTIKKDDMVFVPYVPPGMFKKALGKVKEWKKSSVIFAHQEFLGARFNPTTCSEEGDPWNETFPFVVAGHIHEQQELFDGNVFYTGTPYQTNFGENQKKGVWLFSRTDNGWSKEMFKVGIPRKTTLRKTTETFKVPDKPRPNTRIVVFGTPTELSLFRKSEAYKEALTKGIKLKLSALKPKTEEKQTSRFFKSFNEILDAMTTPEEKQILAGL